MWALVVVPTAGRGQGSGRGPGLQARNGVRVHGKLKERLRLRSGDRHVAKEKGSGAAAQKSVVQGPGEAGATPPSMAGTGKRRGGAPTHHGKEVPAGDGPRTACSSEHPVPGCGQRAGEDAALPGLLTGGRQRGESLTSQTGLGSVQRRLGRTGVFGGGGSRGDAAGAGLRICLRRHSLRKQEVTQPVKERAPGPRVGRGGPSSPRGHPGLLSPDS